MKLIKRIIAIVLLIVTVLVIGYLVYTGSRLTDTYNIKSGNKAEVEYAQSQNL